MTYLNPNYRKSELCNLGEFRYQGLPISSRPLLDFLQPSIAQSFYAQRKMENMVRYFEQIR